MQVQHDIPAGTMPALRRLAETSAMLVAHEDMNRAVITTQNGDGRDVVASTPIDAANFMVLNGWVDHVEACSIFPHYHITTKGRTALDGKSSDLVNSRNALTVPPLRLLAKRVDRDGLPFLSSEQVAAGERFRSDYDAGGDNAIADAVASLGDDDLSNAAVQVCCHLVGIEAFEREMGWPIRSGKVVLRIALNKLSRHYG